MGASDPIHAVMHLPSVQLLGEVVAADSDHRRYTVRSAGHDWMAVRAVSCLVAPAIGDEVLLGGPSAHEVFLIAVTRQGQGGTTHLAVSGDMRISSLGGAISMEGESMTLSGAGAVNLTAAEMNLRADRAGCTFRALDYVGAQARVGVDQVSVVGGLCEIVMDRITQLANSVFRLTRDTEQSRAGRIDCQAEHTLRLHAQHTLLTAQDLVKVDADQIHMG